MADNWGAEMREAQPGTSRLGFGFQARSHLEVSNGFYRQDGSGKSKGEWVVRMPVSVMIEMMNELEPRQVMVMLALDSFARARAVCFPSTAAIVETTKIPTSTVERILGDLEGRGWIERVRVGPKTRLIRLLRRVGEGPTYKPGAEQAMECDPSPVRGHDPSPARDVIRTKKKKRVREENSDQIMADARQRVAVNKMTALGRDVDADESDPTVFGSP
jgi:hypothetical protein